jgi:hypothetical protein
MKFFHFYPSLKERFSHIPKEKRLIWITGLCGLGAGVLVLIIFTALALRRQTSHEVVAVLTTTATIAPTTAPVATPTPTPSEVSAFLDGVLVPNGQEALRPLAVMIENTRDARMQSGLSSASVVYEALVEGGITRFMAVFRDAAAANIQVGPVRSARIYYVDYATELGAFYAHVGGNDQALAQIRATGVLDLDQFSVGAAAYKRIPKGNVALEHTMFGYTADLWKWASQHQGYSTQATFTPWKFTDDALAVNRSASQTVAINFSSPDFNVKWTYNPASNEYLRDEGGVAHIDANTGKQIATKNIILQTVTKGDLESTAHGVALRLGTTGTGKATIIHNGVTEDATWKKEGTGRTQFFHADGTEIQFVRGSSWIELVQSDTPIQM